MRVAPTIELTNKERVKLERIRRGRSSSVRAKQRSAIILLAADGLKNRQIAARLGEDKMKVGRWRTRYAQGGLAAILKDKTPARTHPPNFPGQPVADCEMDAPRKACRGDPLEPDHDGQKGGRQPFERWPGVGGPRVEAASHQGIQAFQ